jgi:hypothetical protein
MKSLKLSGKIEHKRLREIFSQNIDENEYYREYIFSNNETMIVTGSRYMFRTGDYVGFIMISHYDGQYQIIDFGRVGGGRGIMNLRWGAGNTWEKNMMDKLKEEAQKLVLTFEDLGDIKS